MARPAMCGRALCRWITRPACATCSRSSVPGARSTSRPGPFFPNRPPRQPGLNLAQPVVNELGVLTSVVCASIDLDWVVRVHRTFRPSAEHRPDRSRRSGHRPVSLGGSGEVRREARGSVGDGARQRTERSGLCRPRRRRAPVRCRAAGVSRTADGHPRHARDRPGSLSRRPERRAPPQHRPSDDRDAPLFPDCLACRRGAVPPRGPPDHRHGAQGVGRRPRGPYRLRSRARRIAGARPRDRRCGGSAAGLSSRPRGGS